MTLQQLPKVELHLHLDCGLSFDVVSKIDPSVTKQEWVNEYVAPAKCTNLADFLTRAVKGCALMQTTEQLQWVVQDLFEQLAANKTLYAEIRFAPLQHLEKGLTSYEVVSATEQATAIATNQTGIEARLILCTLRHFTEQQSMETVMLAEQFKGTSVAGFDIAANEAGYPLTNHISAFKYAKEKGIYCTAHAGEAKGPDSVWETLEYLGPTRIGHGVRSIEDPRLVEHLRRQNIHLEICPSCNVQIGLYDTFHDHPIDRLYKTGVSISINTDSPTITDTTLTKEYKKLQEAFGWTMDDFYQCNVFALEAAFIPAALKNSLLGRLKEGYQVE
ncbi:MAG: adenosine deaminase [Ferruginibacter sp.]